MRKEKILQKESPILRLRAAEVPLSELQSAKIKRIIERMKRAVSQESDGVAIAAPQIGESLRIFVLSGRAQAIIKKRENSHYPDQVFVNPEIVKSSRKRIRVEEGCLSVRWLYGEVERSEQVTLRAYDKNGKKIERGATGLLAQIFQHEIDHLNGVLFTDKARNLEEIPPKKDAQTR